MKWKRVRPCTSWSGAAGSEREVQLTARDKRKKYNYGKIEVSWETGEREWDSFLGEEEEIRQEVRDRVNREKETQLAGRWKHN